MGLHASSKLVPENYKEGRRYWWILKFAQTESILDRKRMQYYLQSGQLSDIMPLGPLVFAQ